MAKENDNGDPNETLSKPSTGSSCVCESILVFSLVYGCCTLTTQALSLYLSSQITTLEKQYGLSSSESGVILSCNDIGFLLTVLLFSHFGKRYHIPRILGFGVALYGISGLLSSLPQFVSWDSNPSATSGGNVSDSTKKDDFLCDANFENISTSGHTTCPSGYERNSSGFKWVVMYLGICMVVQGVGKSPRSSLGSLYLDNNTEKTKTGLYLGIVQTLGLFGPFLALALGGVFGKIPVDLEETDMTPKDPRWIGAWWIGFLLFGGLALLLAAPLACFPRHLKKVNTKETKDNCENSREKQEQKINDIDENLKSQAKDLPKALIRLLTNPVYVFHLISLLCTMFSVISLTSFGPKYIENQFNIPTWKANIILGVEKLITASIGTFLGGYLTSRLKLDRNGCLKMAALVAFISSAVGSLHFIFGCNNPIIHNENNSHVQPTDSSTTCNCENVRYLAVCGTDGKNYFSPCHAGCLNVTANVYSGCSLIAGGEATSGLCDDECPYLIPYVASSVIQTLVGTMSILPVYIAFLRTVDEGDRALGMGLVSFAVSLLVLLPGPIAFGKLIDTACKYWTTSCGSKGACALYDIVDLRLKVISVGVILRTLSFAFSILTLVLAIRDKNQRYLSKTVDIELNKSI